MPMIDLSSDTVTQPSAEMRQFIAAAPVGDEQNREDPSVNRLQELVAELTGKEAALFVPSGTMCNLIAIKLHTQPGDKVIVDRSAHIYTSEAGGPGLVAGVMTALVDGARGVFTPEQMEEAMAPAGALNSAPTSLICLENTHNRGGGKIWPLATLRGVTDRARALGLRTHLDGARLLNAAVASNIPVSVWAAGVDTVCIDLSKGLGAPVGAVLAGDTRTIAVARRYKQMFGGAMRQAGIIAAGGIYALEHNVGRLTQDHHNAARLAHGLAAIPGVRLDPSEVETNIVYFDVADTGLPATVFNDRLREQGLRMAAGAYGMSRVRAVTHLDIAPADIDRALAIIASVVKVSA